MNQGKKDGLEKPSEDAKATSGSLSRERVIAPPQPLGPLCAVHRINCRIIPLGSLSPSIAPSGLGVWSGGEDCPFVL